MSALALDPIAAVLAQGEDSRCEFAGGSPIEMSPPSSDHVRKGDFLTALVRAYAEAKGLGEVYGDGLAQRLEPGIVRVPDLSYFRPENAHRVGPTYSEGAADLIVEIVFPESRVRDRRDKFFEYAKAGVEEYWIVDPTGPRAEFYRLVEGAYELVEPDEESRAHSSVLPGFSLRVAWLWNPPSLIEALRESGLL